MDYNKMTLMVQQALQHASSIALEKQHTEIDVEHILYSLLDQTEGIAVPLFDSIGVGSSRIKNELNKILSKKPTIMGNVSSQPHLSVNSSNLIIQAEKEMKGLDDEYISVEHLILAMVNLPGQINELFKKFGITRQNILLSLKQIRGNQKVTSQEPESKYRVLQKFTRT